jgi:hypothetical protein
MTKKQSQSVTKPLGKLVYIAILSVAVSFIVAILLVVISKRPPQAKGFKQILIIDELTKKVECYNGFCPEITSKKALPLVKNKITKDKQDEILYKLKVLESRNGTVTKILDTNNKFSLGDYHWQAESVKDTHKSCYGGKRLTTAKAVELALNPILSKELARCTIFTLEQPHRWLISMCKIGHITKGCLNQEQINKLFANK